MVTILKNGKDRDLKAGFIDDLVCVGYLFQPPISVPIAPK